GLATAIRANGRTAEAARSGGVKGGLALAMSGGAAMGLAAIGVSLPGLCFIQWAFGNHAATLGGYALGASLAAMLARTSGGIYAKGADAGADLAGKLAAGIPEDDPRNAAAIADAVGDNAVDSAGMGADLMESYIEAAAAAIFLGSAAASRGAGNL